MLSASRKKWLYNEQILMLSASVLIYWPHLLPHGRNGFKPVAPCLAFNIDIYVSSRVVKRCYVNSIILQPNMWSFI